MICILTIHLLRVACLLMHMVSAAADFPEDICDSAIYGQPSYSACVALLYGSLTRHREGIYGIDSDDHGFLLPYFGGSGEFTIEQWRHRITLPEVWQNDACKIALLVKSSPTGGFTTDSGTWAQIAERGKALIDNCVLVRRATPRSSWSGGVGYAGTHGRLNIVVYSHDSAFDLAMTSGIGPSHLVDVDGNGMANSSASGRTENLTATYNVISE